MIKDRNNHLWNWIEFKEEYISELGTDVHTEHVYYMLADIHKRLKRIENKHKKKI